MRSATATLVFIVVVGVVSAVFGLAAAAAAASGVGFEEEAGVGSGTQFEPGDWLAIVRVHDDAHVRGPDIVLGDIATIETADEQLRTRLQHLVIGRAALPGQRRELHVSTMRTRMRQQRLPVQSVLIDTSTPEVSVRTRANTVSGTVLAEAALTALDAYASSTTHSAAGDAHWMFECALPDEITVVDGLLSVRAQRVSGSAPGALVAAVDVMVAGAVQRTVMVRCDAALERDVLVATTSLKRHEDLQPDAVTVERRTFTSLPREALVPLGVAEELGHWRATRPIGPGAVLTVGMAEPVPAVRRGSRVSIVASLGGIEISVPGVALADGRPGDVIRVENELSGQVVQVLVVDEARVEALLH